MEVKKLYYHLDGLTYGPQADDFLVSMGKKGIGTVYHIADSRKSKASNRYNLQVYVADDLKAATHIEMRRLWVRRRRGWYVSPRAPLAPPRSAKKYGHRRQWRVTVRGKHAWLLYWFSRDKKA